MLTGERVILIPFDKSNWVSINKWIYDPYYKYYFKNMPEMLTQSQMSDFNILMCMNIFMIYDKGMYEGLKFLQGTPEPIGMISWDNIRLLAKTCDFGMLMDKDYSGNHYGYEAAVLVLKYLFHRLNFHKVTISTAEEEIDTCSKVLNKLGCKFEGMARDHFFIDGIWKNENRYSMLREEFDLLYNKYLEKNGEKLWVEKVEEETKLPMKTN